MKYIINGETVSASAFLTHNQAKKRGLLQEMLETNTAPGGQEPYWSAGGFDSVGSGVPEGQAQERRDWIKERGLAGVEIKNDGTAVTASPGNKNAYHAALGLGDNCKAGTDAVALGTKKPRRKINADKAS